MTNVLVTGASGFIGTHLVRRLVERGDRVTCLVRSSSNLSGLEPYRPRFVVGNLTDQSSVRAAVDGAQIVFNLAGTTKALRRDGFERANVLGARVVAECCAALQTPPTLVHVSSLAAAGPSSNGTPRTETEPATPVSNYGKSKLSGETAIGDFSARLPISIVRPPIVLGPGDRDGFEMFRGIANWSLHLVPGLSDHHFSVIHVDDLCEALFRAATEGKRLCPESNDQQGIYFVADGCTPTYAELGQMIGKSLEKNRVHVLRGPLPLIWSIAALNECVSQLRGRPHILSLDKVREAGAGSWTCNADRLLRETSFQTAKPLQERINETTRWYIENGWINR